MSRLTKIAMVLLVLLFAMSLLNGFAQAEDGSVTYTGCLGPAGIISKVAIGDSPARPCRAQQTEVTWSSSSAEPLKNVSCAPGFVVTGFDENGLPICDCFAPFDPVPDELDLFATEYWGIGGGGTGRVTINQEPGGPLVPRNLATIAPGAEFTVSVRYDVIPIPACPSCIVQLQMGFSHLEPEPCFAQGIAPFSGLGTTTFVAPTEPGVYYIDARRTLELSCLPTWEDTFPPDFLNYQRYRIAAICVK